VEISKSNPAECRGWNQSLGCNLNVTPIGWNWTSGDYACFVLTTDAQASWPADINSAIAVSGIMDGQ
jgi:hypothetical protein